MYTFLSLTSKVHSLTVLTSERSLLKLLEVKVKTNRFVTGLAIGSLLLGGFTSAYAAATNMSKQQIEGIVKDYILNNPDVVVQSLQSFQKKQMDQAQKTIEKTQQSSPKYADVLFHQDSDPVAGNPKGKVTVVEFFDYQCPHCVDMAPVIEGLVKNNSDVRIIFKEFPIRGPISEFAAKAALAANAQGKYFEFHKALMDTKQQPLTQDSIIAAAKSVGIDTDKMKTDMAGANVKDQLQKNYKLAQDLQLLGTPAVFVAKTNVSKSSDPTEIIFIPGQVTQDQLQEMIKKVS